MMDDTKRTEYEETLKEKGLPILKTDQYHQITVLVRADLNMSKGKIGAQVAHAVVGADREASAETRRLWDESAQRVVVLKVADETELRAYEALAKQHNMAVCMMIDAGLTEIKPHTLTCMALGPDSVERLKSLTGSLKLY